MKRLGKQGQLKGLVIVRQEGEQVLINHGELKIEVVEVRGKWVKLVFEASKEISIQRAEAALKSTPK